MKQYTNQDQTAKLIELGFPESETSRDYNLDIDKSLINCAYSVGELIEFLESNTSIEIWYDGNYHYWYVDYDMRRVGIDKELINSLYFACVELKNEGVI